MQLFNQMMQKHFGAGSPQNWQQANTNHDQWDQVQVISTKQIGIIISIETVTIINSSTNWLRMKQQECVVRFTDQSESTYMGNQLTYNDEDCEVDCEECDGEGTIDALYDCGMVASMCCGGCTKTIECEACYGAGTVVKDYDQLIKLD